MRGLFIVQSLKRNGLWMKHPLPVLCDLWLLCMFSATSLFAQAQVQENSIPVIKLGMSTALSGPAADLGQNMKRGVQVAIASGNDAGNDRCELVVLDDGYEPNRTIPNIRQLISKEQVLAIIGNVGTPTSVVALPIVRQENICFYGAYTGAGMLRRTPPETQVYNFRASYAQETAAMVRGLLTDGRLKPDEIAFFTQQDSYGDAGYSGGMDALRAYGLEDDTSIIQTRYERNSLCVEQAVAKILMAKVRPRAIIMVGAYAPCAKFIRLARQSGIKAVFLNVSFVGTESLIKALGDEDHDVIITQVVPHPQSDLPVVNAYRQAMAKYAPDAALNFGSLEGYISTVIFQRALEQIQGPVTRQSIIDSLGQMGTFDIGMGVPLSFSSSDHQALDRVWPTIIRDHKAQPLDWLELSDLCQSLAKGDQHD